MKKEKKKPVKAVKIVKGTFKGIKAFWRIFGLFIGCLFIGSIIFCLKTVGIELKGCLGL